MEYWIIGSKSEIILNKHHRNTHGTDKIDNVSQVHHPTTPSIHYSGYKILQAKPGNVSGVLRRASHKK